MLFGIARVRIQTTDAVIFTCYRMLNFIEPLKQEFLLIVSQKEHRGPPRA